MTCVNALLIVQQSGTVKMMNLTQAGDESLSDLLDDWLDDLTNQGRSQHTLTSYRIGVTSFVASQDDSASS
jgi:hypothetical protein